MVLTLTPGSDSSIRYADCFGRRNHSIASRGLSLVQAHTNQRLQDESLCLKRQKSLRPGRVISHTNWLVRLLAVVPRYYLMVGLQCSHLYLHLGLRHEGSTDFPSE